MSEIHEISKEELESIRNQSSYNDDIAPTTAKERTWNKWHIAALWVGMSICVPTYTLGGVLTAYFGLSVPEALWTIFIANIIVLIPLCLNAIAGTKYGIPFPVLLRSSYGILGSNAPAVVRALVACGWFGIQTMFGGLAISILLAKILGWDDGMTFGWGHVIGFFIFWLLNIFVVIKGFDSIKKLESFAAPLLLVIGLALLFWGWGKADMAAVFAQPANRPADASFLTYFLGGLTAMVGFWATLALNIPDFSRYAKSQKDQIVGQIIGLPVTMFIFAALGVVLTGASASIFGETISDPITLISKIDSGVWGVLALLIIILATISTNTAANIVSPTNDFQNMAPRLINMKKGVLLTGVVGILLMSYDLMIKAGWIAGDGFEGRYVGWLLGYSSILGPVAGVMVADFFIVRKQTLNVPDLYKTQGPLGGVNWAGIIATLVPLVLTVSGVLSFNYGWFSGAGIGFVLYIVLAKLLIKEG